jgi:hypothetical protein
MPRPHTPRWISAALLPLLLSGAAAAVPSLQASPARAQAAMPVQGGGQTTAALAEQSARQAADRIFTAVSQRDANGYFSLLAPAAQRVSSPSMAAQALEGLPRLLKWQILSIEPGTDSSSVSALVQTSAGPREVLLILDGQGRMAGYHVNASDQKAVDVVQRFITALSEGQFVSASSYLSPRLVEEIPQPVLQKKWLNLQLYTGNFRKVRKLWRAEKNSLMKLVIVTIEFNRLTDNLFVTLDTSNRIVGIDFPVDPNPPTSAQP